MQATDAVDELFAEAFALLDDATASSSCAAPSAVARRKSWDQGSTARRKRWLTELRGEASVLNRELLWLRGRVSYSALRERALEERARRRRAEHECAQLREALYQHTQFLRGLRGALSVGIPCSLVGTFVWRFGVWILECSHLHGGVQGLNLYHLLHTFTRLPRDASVRQLEYSALRKEQRFVAALGMVEKETKALPVKDLHSEVDFTHASEDPCVITTKRVYTLESDDIEGVRRAACVAVHDLVARFRRYQWVGVAGASVDPEALEATDTQYTVTSIHRTGEHDTEGFTYESRLLTMHKTTNESAVVVWDFVDEDELHPPGASNDVFRQGVGACLIRREECPDGVKRTVYREVNTRRYAYRGPKPPPADVERYISSKQLDIDSYERLYYELVLALVAREQAAISERCVLECSV